MLLALDVGNSQIYGGVFSSLDADAKIKLRFRRNSKNGASSDETGVFLRQVLRENGIDPKKITHIAICSVVPDVMHSLRNSCLKYFNLSPFILQTGVKTGLRVKYRNPVEVGADRISNAIAATQLFPNEDLVIVDLGTATTFCAVSKTRDYLGGLIIPGIRISMEALESKTSRLPSVEIIRPKEFIGKGTVESIQAGLYYSHMGAIREIVTRIQAEAFAGRKPRIIGTGGFAGLFVKEKIFDEEVPDLVLIGLFKALLQNLEADGRAAKTAGTARSQTTFQAAGQGTAEQQGTDAVLEA